MHPHQQAIAITAKYWAMSFVFGLFTPNLTIDGHQVHAAWGRTVVPVPPGQHHVHMHVPYLLPSRVGNADAMVTVQPGQTIEVEYRAPAIGWLDGSMGPAPQQFRGMTAAIVLLIVPLVMLLCFCGLFGIAALNSDSDRTSLPPITHAIKD
ncbi:hypothetical protein [Actinoplanes sp. NPDC049265]|uniref:hypothetical protein n=1 Tax=Actinoplanes sp. NPDC049265 TaxID=3363902 RepID=UPI00371EADE0